MLRASGGGGGADQSPHTGVVSFAAPPSPRNHHHGSSHAEPPQVCTPTSTQTPSQPQALSPTLTPNPKPLQARSELGLADVRTAQQLMDNFALGAAAGRPRAASSSLSVAAHEDAVHGSERIGESTWARVEAAVRTEERLEDAAAVLDRAAPSARVEVRWFC